MTFHIEPCFSPCLTRSEAGWKPPAMPHTLPVRSGSLLLCQPLYQPQPYCLLIESHVQGLAQELLRRLRPTSDCARATGWCAAHCCQVSQLYCLTQRSGRMASPSEAVTRATSGESAEIDYGAVFEVIDHINGSQAKCVEGETCGKREDATWFPGPLPQHRKRYHGGQGKTPESRRACPEPFAPGSCGVRVNGALRSSHPANSPRSFSKPV